jgi:hypothetical protein
VPASGCPTVPTPTYVSICHTNTGAAPYGVLSILDSDVATHQGHGDVYPVPTGGCPPPPATCPAGQSLVNGVCTPPPSNPQSSNPQSTQDNAAAVAAAAIAGVEAEAPTVVAAPEPATVAAPKPATVAVPMKATVPTAVRAGDGSSSTQPGPNNGLLILALVAAGVCMLTTGRLVMARTK